VRILPNWIRLLIPGIFLVLVSFRICAAEPAPGVAEAAQAEEAAPPSDPLGGATEGTKTEEATPSPDLTGKSQPSEETNQSVQKKKLPPLTPDLANLNLPEDLTLTTLDTKEEVFLPAGTYRQILRIPIDSPTIQSVQKTRRERRPEIQVVDPLISSPGSNKKPLWIRYESLEKIKINTEERRGGLDVPIHGPAGVRIRLWYAKSETADAASSVFYFLFGGLGYGVANVAGWSAGNTREIPGDFEYRLIRR